MNLYAVCMRILLTSESRLADFSRKHHLSRTLQRKGLILFRSPLVPPASEIHCVNASNVSNDTTILRKRVTIQTANHGTHWEQEPVRELHRLYSRSRLVSRRESIVSCLLMRHLHPLHHHQQPIVIIPKYHGGWSFSNRLVISQLQ